MEAFFVFWLKGRKVEERQKTIPLDLGTLLYHRSLLTPHRLLVS